MGDLSLKLQARYLDVSLFGKFYNHALGLVYTPLQPFLCIYVYKCACGVTFPCVNCAMHELHVVY